MQCVKCGGDVWDNRQKKVAGQMKPNAPDFSCKDKDGCGWVQWPPKTKASSVGTSAPIAPPSAPQAQSGAPGSQQARLTTLYWECFDEILAGIAKRKLTDLFKAENYPAMVSTLYIQLAKSL